MRPLLLLLPLLLSCPATALAPRPKATEERLDLALDWLMARLDSMEPGQRDAPRYLATAGPSPTQGFLHPVRHSPEWLARTVARLHLSGTCPLDGSCVSGPRAFILAVGFPAAAGPDTSYLHVDYHAWLGPQACRPPPGLGYPSTRTAPPSSPVAYSWTLRLVRTAPGMWALDDPGLTSVSDAFGDPCAVAG